MAELIDRQEIIKIISAAQDSLKSDNDIIWNLNRDYYKGLAWAHRLVLDATAVDAVSVVRCKVCKHWKRNMHVNIEHGLCKRISFASITMHENDFCSRGERMETSGD